MTTEKAAIAKLKMDLKGDLDRPTNQGTTFGDAAHRQAVLAAKVAIRSITAKGAIDSSTRGMLSDADAIVVKYKSQLNDGDGTHFIKSAADVKAEFWDDTQTAKASRTMEQEFESKLIAADAEENHDKYAPKGTPVWRVNKLTGEQTLSYQTRSGQNFTVKVSKNKSHLSIKGTGLTIKPVGDKSGKVEAPDKDNPLTPKAHPNPLDAPASGGLNRAHIIADRFRGSGFRNAGNIIATSATYNQGEMKDVETRIADAILAFKDVDSFNLTVNVTFGKVDAQDMIDLLAIEDKAYAKKENADLVLAQVTKLEANGVKRVMSLEYLPTVVHSNGTKEPVEGDYALGPDIYLGIVGD